MLFWAGVVGKSNSVVLHILSTLFAFVCFVFNLYLIDMNRDQTLNGLRYGYCLWAENGSLSAHVSANINEWINFIVMSSMKVILTLLFGLHFQNSNGIFTTPIHLDSRIVQFF